MDTDVKDSTKHRLCALMLSGFIVTILPTMVQAQRTMTVEEERALEAERVREAERAREEAERAGDLQRTREMQRTRETERAGAYETERARAERARIYEEERARAYHDRRYDYHEPGELYVAGFGGYTFGHELSNVRGTGPLAGANFPDFGLKNSGVYGAKLGYFLPDKLNWLGFEVEGFNTTPHIEQNGPSPGNHLRVTTAAFNVIARAKMGCTHDDRYDRDRPRRVSTDSDSGYGDRGFCRIQPYAGVGLGLFFARASAVGNGGGTSDNAVPGLNALAGVRFFVTEHVAVFGEYKYNRASFEFDNVRQDYSVSHVVGGLSFHF